MECIEERRSARLRGVLAMVVAALVLATAFTACGGSNSDGDSAGTSDGGTIAYGVITPFTGSYAAYGMPEKASVEAAVNAVNAQGGIKVGGKTYKLEAKAYDSGFDPSKAVTEARRAITQDGVRYLEILGGELIPPVQPVAGDNALIFGVANGSTFLGADQPTTFRAWYDLPTSVAASLRYLKPKLGTDSPRVVMLYPEGARGKELSAASGKRAEELGYSATTTFTDPSATDFTAVLTKVLGDKPDVIDFGFTSPSAYAVAVKQARQLGYKGRFVFPDTLVQSVLNKTAGKGAAAGSVTSPLFTSFSTPAGRKWAQYVEDRSGPLQGWAAVSYDNVFLLKAAIEQAQSLEPTKVAKALLQVRLDHGLLGQVRYEQRPEVHDGYTMVGIKYPVGELTADGRVKTVASYVG